MSSARSPLPNSDAEAPSCSAHARLAVVRVADAVLEVGAVDRGRAAGAAEVDQQQVARVEQRVEQEREAVRRRGRGEARPALGGEDRAGRRAGVAVRDDREEDRDRGAARVAAVERHVDRAAQRARRVVAGGERVPEAFSARARRRAAAARWSFGVGADLIAAEAE